VRPAAGITGEKGTADTFTVVLDTQPAYPDRHASQLPPVGWTVSSNHPFGEATRRRRGPAGTCTGRPHPVRETISVARVGVHDVVNTDARSRGAFGACGGGDLRALRVARKRVPDCSPSGDRSNQASPR
jgi:hypothetical protein